ncbi:thiamine diphosphate-binding protein [Exophiala viscosa]|uniref:thiamine diphosphate-binding protein n=1 Tax=Exophiala viscosa TaxID=2486360 RepID=UPI00219C72AA|nr:thiamine diphosphate-binding protein [Exophiala viscosa]
MSNPGTPLGLLLWQKIRSLNTRSIMGVPGDMNLELLDYINEVDGMSWVGNANELNAAYAADAYCRVSGSPGVLVTTMGVGELSAINGIAGSYTEQVKVIHIVGTTSRTAMEKHLMIHHCLGPSPDHKVYEKTSQHVRAAHCWLDNPATAAREIDRVIHECYAQSLPVYIFIPSDMVHLRVPDQPSTGLDLVPRTDKFSRESAISVTLPLLYNAKAPAVIVDGLTARHLGSDVTRELVDLLQFPTYSTSIGKGIVDETKPYFCGIYNGQVSIPGVCEAVEQQSDLVLDLGPLLSDSNTGGHTRSIAEHKLIQVHPHHVSVRGVAYRNIGLVEFLSTLLKSVDESRLPRLTAPGRSPLPPAKDADSDSITQSWIWTRFGEFCKPGDILIADSGTAQFGLPDAHLPQGATFLTQLYYGSIGYSVPACLGAAIVYREQQREGRVILVVGDGSLQLTVQEIGTMIKLGLKNILIVVINNNGYTIERVIHGPEEAYNDIAVWNHSAMLEFFGAKNGRACTREVRTKKEFDEVASLPEYQRPTSIQVLEVFMDKMDVPWRLQRQIEIINERNAQA